MHAYFILKACARESTDFTSKKQSGYTYMYVYFVLKSCAHAAAKTSRLYMHVYLVLKVQVHFYSHLFTLR